VIEREIARGRAGESPMTLEKFAIGIKHPSGSGLGNNVGIFYVKRSEAMGNYIDRSCRSMVRRLRGVSSHLAVFLRLRIPKRNVSLREASSANEIAG